MQSVYFSIPSQLVWVEKTGLFNLGMATGVEKGKLNSNLLNLKIQLMLYSLNGSGKSIQSLRMLETF